MKNRLLNDARERLIDSAGRTTQDFGMGRIVGQVMAVLYLTPEELSLDAIGKELALSKAAISIATRQLEGLGLIQRLWLQGDKRAYFKTVDNLAVALQHGILDMIRSKLRAGANDLNFAAECLKEATKNSEAPPSELKFLKNQIKRAGKIRSKASWVLNNPLIKLIGR